MPANPLQSYAGSVVQDAPTPNGNSGVSDYILYMAGMADSITPWGNAPKSRDRQLRDFWPTEPILAGALYSTTVRYAGFQWSLDGSERMVQMYTRILHSSQHGYGWQAMAVPFVTDYFSQDNGAFLEIVRTEDAPTAPVIQLNHLDAGRCERTGNAEFPVVYYDRDNNGHRLRWYQVIMLTEMPSPIEKHNGRQYCAVTRILNAAQLMRDVTQYKRERATGLDTKQIHLVSGVSTARIDQAIADSRRESQGVGFTRYARPVVVGSPNPEARAQAATIDLAKLSDGYDEEKAQRDYITIVALALGGDYQDYAPLPVGAQGSGAQSEVLALKSRGKGPNFFMRAMEFIFNYHGILPQGLTFEYGDQDAAADLDAVKLRTLRAEERAMRIKSGEINPDVAREIAVASGDLTPEQAQALAGYVAPTPAPAGEGTRDGGRPRTDGQQGGTPAASVQTA